MSNLSSHVERTLTPAGGSSVSLSAMDNVIITNNLKKSPTDFVFIKTIGEGSFSTVYVGREVDTGREFASNFC